MDSLNRREILGRLTALLAGPLLLGRRAMDMALRAGRRQPPPAPPPRPKAPTLAPPTRSVQRRG